MPGQGKRPRSEVNVVCVWPAPGPVQRSHRQVEQPRGCPPGGWVWEPGCRQLPSCARPDFLPRLGQPVPGPFASSLWPRCGKNPGSAVAEPPILLRAQASPTTPTSFPSRGWALGLHRGTRRWSMLPTSWDLSRGSPHTVPCPGPSVSRRLCPHSSCSSPPTALCRSIDAIPDNQKFKQLQRELSQVLTQRQIYIQPDN